MKKYFQKSFADQSKIEYWDNIYDRQDFYGDCYRQRMRKALAWLDGLTLPKNSRILDAGCGAGRVAQEAAKRGYSVFGIDYSYGMLVEASHILNADELQQGRLCQADVEAVPYRDASFDVIICLGVIAYLESEEKALGELARVLKPGGVLVLSIVNKARPVRLMDLPLLSKKAYWRILNKLVPSRKKSAGSGNGSSLTTYFIPNTLKSLEQAGFTVCEYETIPLDLLTFFDREILPRKMAISITLFFERFSNIPLVGSFGGMCIFKAERNSGAVTGSRRLALPETSHMKGRT